MSCGCGEIWWHVSMAIKHGDWSFHFWTPKPKLGVTFVYYDGHHWYLNFKLFGIGLFY